MIHNDPTSIFFFVLQKKDGRQSAVSFRSAVRRSQQDVTSPAQCVSISATNETTGDYYVMLSCDRRLAASPIYAIDSTTISACPELHRQAKRGHRKTVTKSHVLLNIANALPSVVVVDSANHHVSTRAAALTAEVKAGDSLLADRGSSDFGFLFRLEIGRAFFVTRQRGWLKYEAKKPHEVSGDVVSNEAVFLTGDKAKKKYTKPLRRVSSGCHVAMG